MSAYKNYDFVNFHLRESSLLEIIFNYTINILKTDIEKEKRGRQVPRKETHNFSLALKIQKEITVGGQRLSEALIKKFITHFATRHGANVQYTSLLIRTPDVSLRTYLSEPIFGTHQEALFGRYTCKVQRFEQPTLITHVEEIVQFKNQQPIDFLLPFIQPGTLTIPLEGSEVAKTLECSFNGFSTQNRYVSTKILGIFESVEPYLDQD